MATELATDIQSYLDNLNITIRSQSERIKILENRLSYLEKQVCAPNASTQYGLPLKY